jgi:uncharacterized membrane protein
MKALRRYLIPIGIALLAFGLRMAWLDARPLWYDEAFSVFLSERGPAAIVSGTAADTDPPGYYFLLWQWMNLVGQTPLALRMLGVGISVTIAALVYATGRRAFGANAGNWAALLVAVMPFQIYHAQEARMYALLGLGVCLYLYGVVDAAMQPGTGFSRRAFATIALGTFIALWSQNLAFATFLGGHVYCIARGMRVRGEWRKERQLIAAQALAFLFYVPWLFYLPSQLAKVQRAFYTQPPGGLDVLQLVMVQTGYLPLPAPVTGAALFVTILVLTFAGYALAKRARRGGGAALGVMAAFLLVPPTVLFVVSYLMRPVFVPRGLVVTGLTLALVLGMLAAGAARPVRYGLAGLVIVFYAAVLPFYYTYFGEWRRAPFAEANAFLRAEWREGDVILHDNKLTYLPMHLDDRTLPQVFLADPLHSDNDTFAPASQAAMGLGPTKFEEAVEGSGRVWFVIFQTALDEADAAEVEHPNVARLDGFERAQETRYGDVVVLLYTVR